MRGAPQPIPSDSSNGMVKLLKSNLQMKSSKKSSCSIQIFTPGHPEFVAGAGYIIPGRIISDLYLATLSTRLIPVEDAFTTGYCAKKVSPKFYKNTYVWKSGIKLTYFQFLFF